MTWNTTGCTDVVINFGQWLAAAELQRPETVHNYVSKLRVTISHLLTLRQAGARVFWMTTNSFPIWRGAWCVPFTQRTSPSAFVCTALYVTLSTCML